MTPETRQLPVIKSISAESSRDISDMNIRLVRNLSGQLLGASLALIETGNLETFARLNPDTKTSMINRQRARLPLVLLPENANEMEHESRMFDDELDAVEQYHLQTLCVMDYIYETTEVKKSPEVEAALPLIYRLLMSRPTLNADDINAYNYRHLDTSKIENLSLVSVMADRYMVYMQQHGASYLEKEAEIKQWKSDVALELARQEMQPVLGVALIKSGLTLLHAADYPHQVSRESGAKLRKIALEMIAAIADKFARLNTRANVPGATVPPELEDQFNALHSAINAHYRNQNNESILDLARAYLHPYIKDLHPEFQVIALTELSKQLVEIYKPRFIRPNPIDSEEERFWLWQQMPNRKTHPIHLKNTGTKTQKIVHGQPNISVLEAEPTDTAILYSVDDLIQSPTKILEVHLASRRKWFDEMIENKDHFIDNKESHADPLWIDAWKRTIDGDLRRIMTASPGYLGVPNLIKDKEDKISIFNINLCKYLWSVINTVDTKHTTDTEANVILEKSADKELRIKAAAALFRLSLI